MLLNHDQFAESTTIEGADILIFNSCAVRATAENRLFARIQELAGRRRKAKRPVTMVLAGCIPQYEKESIIKEHPYIDFVVGANSLEFLPELLLHDGRHDSSFPRIKISDNKDTTLININPKRTPLDQAFVPIMFGCDNFCSYCIVPFTRGREVSRTKQSILEEIHALAGSSFQKVLLLGQNVNSYGQGLYADYDFADLLQEIHSLSFINKIDFLTSHPKDMSDKLIATIAELPKMGKEIHVPLQAGDDIILKAMNRGYRYADYVQLVSKIRKTIPSAHISTDIIVGFPGETQKQFEASINAVKTLGFHRVISSAYSPRKGTTAANMSDQIKDSVKRTRLLELQRVVQEYSFGNKPPVENNIDS